MRGDICQLYHIPMREPSYNPIRLLRTYKGTYGTVRYAGFTPEAEVMALGGDDAKIRVYPIPGVKKMNRITTLVGLRAQTRGCWIGGETELDILAVDSSGMVCIWQQDYHRTELEFDLETSPRFFSPNLLKRLRKQAREEIIELEEKEDEVMASDNSDSESESDDDEMIRFRRTYKDFVNPKGEKASPLMSADYHQKSRMLACGHQNGSFSLFEVHWASDASQQASLIEMQARVRESFQSGCLST